MIRLIKYTVLIAGLAFLGFVALMNLTPGYFQPGNCSCGVKYLTDEQAGKERLASVCALTGVCNQTFGEKILLLLAKLDFNKGPSVTLPQASIPSSVTTTTLPIATDTVGWKTYTNGVDRYQINFPPTWHWTEHRSSLNEVFIESSEPDSQVPNIGRYQVDIDTRKLFPGQTMEDAVRENNQTGAQEFNPGGPKPPLSINIRSTPFVRNYYYVVLANNHRSAAIPLAAKDSLIFIHVLNWPQDQDYSLFDQILSTFKFTN
ncbi:MAG: hypothetical protein M1352_01730 [Patescibacteria group bacterium]|nr:hypothetical protein [Patescibacteria group bacterium]